MASLVSSLVVANGFFEEGFVETSDTSCSSFCVDSMILSSDVDVATVPVAVVEVGGDLERDDGLAEAVWENGGIGDNAVPDGLKVPGEPNLGRPATPTEAVGVCEVFKSVEAAAAAAASAARRSALVFRCICGLFSDISLNCASKSSSSSTGMVALSVSG